MTQAMTFRPNLLVLCGKKKRVAVHKGHHKACSENKFKRMCPGNNGHHHHGIQT